VRGTSLRLLISLSALGLALTGCGTSAHKSSTDVTKPESRNLLTNLPGGNGPVLAIKIDDTPQAHPQINLEKADVLYIEQVEGGLSRIAALFTNPANLPELVGPVRSARISDLDILAPYGHVGFIFSGAQRLFYPKIDAANLENLSADHEPASIYSRDRSRVEPTNLIVHPQALLAKSIGVEKRRIDIVSNSGWTFGAAPVGGTSISDVSFSWPTSKYSARWSQAEKRWLFWYNGAPDLAASGMQLGSPTLIIQKVVITPSIYHDKVGGITPFTQTVGSGTAYLLRDGKAFPIFWNRAQAQLPTTWTLKDGTAAHFATGQIWIALTDSEPKFTQSASPAPTK
jgi:Protein of unknown function (DUF3048) N-terminal domain/Protein of unknown function (DUF3048) C-terminal domain